MDMFEIWLTRAMQKGNLLAYCAFWLLIKLGKRLCDETQVQLIKMLNDETPRVKELLFLYRKNHSLCFAAWQEFAKLNKEGNNKVEVLLDAEYYWYMRSDKTPEDFSKYITGGLVDAARLRRAIWSLP